MLLGSVQISRERLSSVEINDLCENLRQNSVRLLALRHCATKDADFTNLAKAVGVSKALLHLNLNLGLLNSHKRVEALAQELYLNRSLTTLLVHGNALGDDGVRALCGSLAVHPNVIHLDLGDCKMTQMGIAHISKLLPEQGAKRGLHDLTLSANPGISSQGWAQFFISMAAGCSLRSLHIDYNQIGDYGAGCLAVALATVKTLEMIDLEGCGITDHGGQVLLYAVQKHQPNLRQMIVKGNTLKSRTLRYFGTILPQTPTKQVSDDAVSSASVTTTSQSGSNSEEDDASVQVSPRENHLSVRTRRTVKKMGTDSSRSTPDRSSNLKHRELSGYENGVEFRTHQEKASGIKYIKHGKVATEDSESYESSDGSESETFSENESKPVFRISGRAGTDTVITEGNSTSENIDSEYYHILKTK